MIALQQCRHNFTTQTIARIQAALGCNLINIAH